MNEVEEEPRLLKYLPAIFQEKGEQEGDPLRAFLSIFDHFFIGIEEEINKIDTCFDPFLASVSPDKAGRDFLSWLASWVSLKLDEGWYERKKRYLIQNAARLYRFRGTIQGLKYMLDQFLNIQVDIKEWSWPQGMELGTHSAIGIDTFLVERPNLNHCFMVIWRPLLRDIESESIKKARAMIDLEKPAHTKCFFQLEYPEEEIAKPEAMIIEITSKIGQCYINQEANND